MSVIYVSMLPDKTLLHSLLFRPSPRSFALVRVCMCVWYEYDLCVRVARQESTSNAPFQTLSKEFCAGACVYVYACASYECNLCERVAPRQILFTRFCAGESEWMTNVQPEHAATHFNTLQHPATPCNSLQHPAAHCSTLQHTAAHCSTLQRTATHCSTLTYTLQHITMHCNTPQHTATHCNTLQHAATHYNTGCNIIQEHCNGKE